MCGHCCAMATMPSPPIVAASGTLHHTTHSRRRSSASSSTPSTHNRRSSTHSIYARNVLMSNLRLSGLEHAQNKFLSNSEPSRPGSTSSVPAPPKGVQDIKDFAARHGELRPPPAITGQIHPPSHVTSKDGVGTALSDTPAPSHPGSPREYAMPLPSIALSADSHSTLTPPASQSPRSRPTARLHSAMSAPSSSSSWLACLHEASHTLQRRWRGT
jgi:6-phosphofructo-2-kinase